MSAPARGQFATLLGYPRLRFRPVAISFLPQHLRRWIVRGLADRAAAHPLGRWALMHAVCASERPSPSMLRAAGLHLRSAFVRQPQLAVAVTRHGTSMVVDLSDWRHHELLACGIYEAHVTALLHRLANPGWTFLDVGANVGYFAGLASRLGGPTATVHAFEPHPRMAGMAEINARMTDGVRYNVIEAACGARPGRFVMHLASTPGNIGDSTMISQPGSLAPTKEVRVVTLDGHCGRLGLRPDVIKVDVEGFEFQVIEGMTRLLTEGVPSHLIIELGGEPERPPASAAVERLHEVGYEARGVTLEGQLTSYLPQQDLQDVCFVRRTG